MRLTLSFLVLLVIATAAAGLAWGNFADARAGDAVARLIVFLAAPVGAASLALLGRIMVQVSAVRRAGKEA